MCVASVGPGAGRGARRAGGTGPSDPAASGVPATSGPAASGVPALKLKRRGPALRRPAAESVSLLAWPTRPVTDVASPPRERRHRPVAASAPGAPSSPRHPAGPWHAGRHGTPETCARGRPFFGGERVSEGLRPFSATGAAGGRRRSCLSSMPRRRRT